VQYPVATNYEDVPHDRVDIDSGVPCSGHHAIVGRWCVAILGRNAGEQADWVGRFRSPRDVRDRQLPGSPVRSEFDAAACPSIWILRQILYIAQITIFSALQIGGNFPER
jgi:hypothetical protein